MTPTDAFQGILSYALDDINETEAVQFERKTKLMLLISKVNPLVRLTEDKSLLYLLSNVT